MAVREMVTNGINMESFKTTVHALKKNPELGKSKFRVHNHWENGGQNTSRVGEYFALGEEIEHQPAFDLYADEPSALGGKDKAPNPVEHLLHALASCVTTSIIVHAAVNRIEIEELDSQIEGDIDLRGLLGLDGKVPKGFQNIRINFKVKTDPKNIEKLKKLPEFSPVYNTLLQGTNVEVDIESV